MLQNYVRQLLVFAFILVSFTALGQSFGTSVSARYGDGCRLDFYNSTNVKIFSLRGSELRYWYNPSGQIIVRDENTQVTDLFGISGLAALIDSVQSVCLAGLCGGTTPIETFAYCGSPVFDFWLGQSSGISKDTTAFNPINIRWGFNATTENVTLHLFKGMVANQFFTSECYYLISPCDTIQECIDGISLCSNIASFQATLNGNTEDSVYTFCDISTNNIASNYYQFNGSEQYKDTSTLLLNVITDNADTTIIKNNFFIDSVVVGNGVLFTRFIGVVISGFTELDSTNSLVNIIARPVKTSGQTYAASSFKIEKIAFADITAGTIEGGSYNPNLGEQTIELPITTGKNTFKVSVEDTDGNIAYSIFQITKTAL